ncbi:hypothetical protein Tco_1075571 [Tanacetum coccineum]
MDNPNITMEEYIRLEEEKAHRRGKVYNWETATYAFNDTLTSQATLSCEPTVSSLNNNKIDFRISFDESNDEDCMMSEAENHPPASSVTELRIPIIKKGEYDIWCMKMRQYIAITDHILWDIITNGDQATTEPASSSGQPSAPNRRLLSFHDAQDDRSLWAAIKARFGGNKESKKMQKNL